MKYSEFKSEVEKLGWCVSGNKYELHVLTHGGGKLVVIDKTDTHVLDPDHISYVTLTHEDKSALLDLSVKLAKTPLSEREEEKKYRLRISAPLVTNDEYVYLTYIPVSDWYQLGSAKRNDNLFKTIFTESEIAQMDITGFEKVEVVE